MLQASVHPDLTHPRHRRAGSPRKGALALTAALALALPCLAPTIGRAQEIVLSVNGDPVTSVDIDQRMKMLRALHRPATRDAAIESMVESRLKQREASRFGISVKDEEMPEQIQRIAKRMKVTPQQIAADITKAGVSQVAASAYLKTELAYSILIRALNRGVEASEVQVRQELAKEKAAKTGGIVNYTLRQVVFTMNPGDSQLALQARAKDAEALRAKFTTCEDGIPYAKSLPGVAVREKLVRSSSQLPESFRGVLDKTPLGHLTAPSRSPNGLELVAVCERTTTRNDDELRKEIADRILASHYEAQEAVKLKEMRASAVIEKR